MKTQKVWILPDNLDTNSPVNWVDNEDPQFQDAAKGPFIECEAKILNVGGVKSFFDDDINSMSDAPYETKGIVVEKLMQIRGCKTTRSITPATSSTPAVIKKKKYPLSYIFLKKPTWEQSGGGDFVSTQNQDLVMTDIGDFSIFWDFSDANYSLYYPANSVIQDSAGTDVTTSYYTGSGGLEIYLKKPDDSELLIASISTQHLSGLSYWNDTYYNLRAWQKRAGTRPTTINFTTEASEAGQLLRGSCTLPSTYWSATEQAAFISDSTIPQGTKWVAKFAINTKSGNTVTTKYSNEIDLGYVYSTGLNLKTTLYKVAEFATANFPVAPLYIPVENFTNTTQITPEVPSTGLLTKNTPCWTFLGDIRRVMNGGKPVMKGTIRYLSYMADLQPEGDDFRDYEPYEIGE